MNNQEIILKINAVLHKTEESSIDNELIKILILTFRFYI